MRRTVEPELLDSGCGTPEEIAATLSDLRMVNRRFGGISTAEKLVRRVAVTADRPCLELLDVASASGDVPFAVTSRLKHEGVHLQTTLLDRKAAHLPPVPYAVVGDALDLPFPAESFDLVTCSLFAHHLEPPTLKHFVHEAMRVARVALIINDLVRSRLHLGLLYAARPLFRSHMAWHDGIISIRRAYTTRELQALLADMGYRLEISRHFLMRLGVIVWK